MDACPDGIRLLPKMFYTGFYADIKVMLISKLCFWNRFARLCLPGLFCLFPSVLFADKFEFRHNLGDKFRIVSTADEEVYKNSKLIHKASIVNRMASEVIDIKDETATLNAVFNVANESVTADKTRRLQWGEEYTSVFTRNKLGKIVIDKKYYMPTLRDVPLFPERDLNPGDSWISHGSEVFDMRANFEINEPYVVPFTANNTYVGEKIWRNKKYKAFSITYNLLKRENVEGFENAPKSYLTDPKAAGNSQSKPVIKRITGKSVQTIYWDDALGQIIAGEDQYELKIELAANNEIFEFRGKTVSEIIEADTLDKEDVIRDIQEQIEKLGLEDVSVKVVDEGIAISLDNVQFAADSAVLLPAEKLKLDKISEILQKYKNRDILVAGHTALAGTASEHSHLQLSEERAASVADYLIKKNVRAPERIITRGYGYSRPAENNNTEEGRRKNRRVEITILEN